MSSSSKAAVYATSKRQNSYMKTHGKGIYAKSRFAKSQMEGSAVGSAVGSSVAKRQGAAKEDAEARPRGEIKSAADEGGEVGGRTETGAGGGRGEEEREGREEVEAVEGVRDDAFAALEPEEEGGEEKAGAETGAGAEVRQQRRRRSLADWIRGRGSEESEEVTGSRRGAKVSPGMTGRRTEGACEGRRSVEALREEERRKTVGTDTGGRVLPELGAAGSGMRGEAPGNGASGVAGTPKSGRWLRGAKAERRGVESDGGGARRWSVQMKRTDKGWVDEGESGRSRAGPPASGKEGSGVRGDREGDGAASVRAKGDRRKSIGSALAAASTIDEATMRSEMLRAVRQGYVAPRGGQYHAHRAEEARDMAHVAASGHGAMVGHILNDEVTAFAALQPSSRPHRVDRQLVSLPVWCRLHYRPARVSR